MLPILRIRIGTFARLALMNECRHGRLAVGRGFRCRVLESFHMERTSRPVSCIIWSLESPAWFILAILGRKVGRASLVEWLLNFG